MLKVIEQFGGEIAILNMTILVFMFFFIATLLKNNKLRLLYSLIVSFFVTLQIISLYSTQSFIGYQFYVHCNLRGISSMSSLFIPHIISSIFIFTLLVVINYHSIKLIYQSSMKNKNHIMFSLHKSSPISQKVRLPL